MRYQLVCLFRIVTNGQIRNMYFLKIAAAVREPEASEHGSSQIGVLQYIKGAKKSHFVQAQSIVVDFRSGCFAV